MNKLLLCGAFFMGLSAHAQTTLFQDNFEAGAGNWTLNGGTGDNQWIVNNVFESGFTPMIPNTPPQPAGITNGPNSSFLHIYNDVTCSFLSVCNATFDAASAANRTVQSANPIVTTGYSSVTLSFYYLSAGDVTEAYGTLEYSTDNTNWIPTGTHYVGVSTWTLETVSLPAWDNQTQLKFRFRWFNTDSEIGSDPAFSIDELKVTGILGAGATVNTGTIAPATYCLDTEIAVPFTVTGTITAGNVYTAQLSNSSGSFASPTAVGTLSSNSTGTLYIYAMIPNGTPAGSGYRIRVDASSPATIGTDNGANLTFEAKPVVSVNSVPANATICIGSSASLTASGANTYAWSTGATGANVTVSPASTQTYMVVGSSAGGCQDTTAFTVTVQACAGLEEASFGDFELYPNPVSQDLYVNFGELKGLQSVSVLDLSGRKVLASEVNSAIIDLSALETGKYFLLIDHEAGVSVKGFIKQ